MCSMIFMGMENVLFYLVIIAGIISGLILIKELFINILFKVEYYLDWKDRDENLEPKVKKRYIKR